MLLGAAAILVLGAVGLCWLYLHNTGEMRSLQGQAQQLQIRQQGVNALVQDVAAYSETIPPSLLSWSPRASPTGPKPQPSNCYG
jgi:hypothetical protein